MLYPRISAALFSAMFFALSVPARAATIIIPVDQPTIQAGINAAVSGVDEVIVADGTYSEIIDFGGKAITVRSVNGAAVTIIDATLAANPGTGKPVVRCDSGEGPGTVLDGFTITGGTGDTSFNGNALGGGMWINGSNPTVKNCTFTGNTALSGGGMLNRNNSSTVMNCTFSGNTGNLSGGGMENSGSAPTVTNCTFSGNTTGASGTGGGMLNQSNSSPTLIDCVFTGNSAANGGGMANNISSPSVTNCTFSGNTATSNGGGMHNTTNSSPTVTNCTFSGNSAVSDGGGMFVGDGFSTVTNCIFWENSDVGGMDESAQIFVFSGVPTVNYADIQGGWTGAGGTGNLNVNPLFVNAAGGDFHLQAGSPCMDVGDNNAVTEPTDLDGNPRRVNCTVDMGAYEDQTATSLVQNITQGTFFTTIQSAINAAVASDVIEASPCMYNEIIDFLGKPITLRSTDPTNPAVVAATIINAAAVADPGDGLPVVRCDNGETVGTVLDGFTITGGTGDSLFSTSGGTGGGMFLSASSPTVRNCTFTGNAITYRGAGIANTGGASPTVTNCTFDGNSGSGGGGMYNSSSSPTVTNCTFSGNTVTSNGGGIYNNSGSPTVTSCTFSGNVAGSNGSGIYNTNSSPTVTNCAFSGNTANNLGGGIRNFGGSSPTLTNCTFSGNSASSGGGMANTSSTPTVTNCTFSGNTSTSNGAGMYNSSSSSPTVTNCMFDGNTATSNGGGMYNNNSSPTMANCTFSGNVANNQGGGMRNFSGSGPTLTNCTFSANTATSNGGGIANSTSSPGITNCIFWGNSDAGGMDESAQIHTSSGTPVVNFSDVLGGWTGAGGTGNLNADPLFVDSNGADNVLGTVDDDLRLLSGSPCIDVGDNSVVSEPTDPDGNTRILKCTVDMGAYEFALSIIKADLDCDSDVDGNDFLTFSNCFNGALNPPKPGCPNACADIDQDGDVDPNDFLTFSNCFNGSLNPPACL